MPFYLMKDFLSGTSVLLQDYYVVIHIGNDNIYLSLNVIYETINEIIFDHTAKGSEQHLECL